MNKHLFAKFKRILKENPELEQAAMQDTLDDGTDISEFDVDMSPPENTNTIADAMSQEQQAQLNELQGWISQINGFLKFLNGDNPDSVQSKLSRAVPDTMMEKIKTSEQSTITRIASDLASLEQALIGKKALSKSPQLKGV